VLSVTSTNRKGLSRPFIVFGVAVGLFCVAYAALSLAALTVSRSDESTHVYSDVQRLRIEGGNGDITVVAEQRDDVQVTARRTWSLGRPDVEQGFEGGVLKLSGSCGFWGSIGPNGCSTTFVVHVPRNLEVDVRGSSGDVTGRGLAGSAYLCTSSGDVEAIDVSGPLIVRASSGDVTVDGYGGADVSAHASSGDVEVVTRSVPQRVEAVASSGDVTVAVPGGVPYHVETDTSSGDEDVQVDQSQDAPRTIEARASSGDVRVVRLDDGG
jgi:hypothetical protein